MYADLEADRLREIKHLVDENARLKWSVAEISLDMAILQDVFLRKFPGHRS